MVQSIRSQRNQADGEATNKREIKMITVTCQYTGIEFEARSKRSKNHPQVSEFLNAANKDSNHYRGSYQAAKDIFAQIKTQNITKIDEAMQLAAQAYEEWKSGDAAPVIRKTQGDLLREKKQYSKEREKINSVLRQHGYRWHKEDEESMDFAGATAFESTYGRGLSYVWTLSAPDGREVTINQALAEIEKNKA
jgi:hypothetical protein